MTSKLLNVLFLCDSNSTLSIFGEAILNRMGRGRFCGFSAGPHPKPKIDDMTLYQLERNNYSHEDLRVNDWNDYAADDAPRMDFIIVLTGSIAAEDLPDWPGEPMIAQWHIDDPMGAGETDLATKAAFARALTELESRISIFVNLPIASLDRLKLQQRLNDIGR
jgi:arsenate reductase